MLVLSEIGLKEDADATLWNRYQSIDDLQNYLAILRNVGNYLDESGDCLALTVTRKTRKMLKAKALRVDENVKRMVSQV